MNVIKEGVYFLLKSGNVVYIGESDNVLRRIGQHISEGKKDFDSFEVYPTPDRKRLEGFLIRSLKPKYNISEGKAPESSREDWFPTMGQKEAVECYERQNEYIPIREIADDIGLETRFIVSQSIKKGYPVCLVDGRWKIRRAFLDSCNGTFAALICKE